MPRYCVKQQAVWDYHWRRGRGMVGHYHKLNWSRYACGALLVHPAADWVTSWMANGVLYVRIFFN